MQPQALFRLHLASCQFSKQFRDAFQVWSKLHFSLCQRPLQISLLQCIERRPDPLRHSRGKIIRPPVQFGSLRVQDLFESAVKFVQSVVARRFQLRRIFFRPARYGFDLGQCSARARHLPVK